MSTDHIRYDLLTQEALRGLVRRVLGDAARMGLPGEHHFFISFKTQYPGVSIPARLAEKFPEEITIVLQHQFWDLIVSDSGFEVGLSFGNAPERLVVPFAAVTAFFDPSVEFGVKFEVIDPNAEEAESAEAEPQSPVRAVSHSAREEDAAIPAEAVATLKPAKKKAGKEKAEKEAEMAAEGEAADEESSASPAESEKVVSLEHFRKKK